MSYFEELEVQKYINAHDTRTVYGGSRMSRETLAAMNEASEHFVDYAELQRKAGEKIAELTHNEAAYVCNGSSGGIMTAAAVCMTGDSFYRYRELPTAAEGTKTEFIVFRCQHNAYDKSIEAAGGKIVYIGDADETLDFELDGKINSNTAGVFYFDPVIYAKASMSLEKTIEIAHRHGVPVIVDAAAQLPPTENLWKYTGMGADMAIFSGGKTLAGPQNSGLILGKKEYIDLCLKFGAPEHGVLRSCKTSREDIAGLYAALRQYLALDEQEEFARLYHICERIADAAGDLRGIQKTEIVNYGAVGQTYPRVFMYFENNEQVRDLVQYMRDHHIFIGDDSFNMAAYISPLGLNEAETEIVIQELKKHQ